MNKHVAEISDLIQATLEKASSYCDVYLGLADKLVLGTGAKESHYKKIRQIGYGYGQSGGAFGYLQIEEFTATRVLAFFEKYYPKLWKHVTDIMWSCSLKLNLMHNLPFAILICRGAYLSINRPLPARDDVAGMAAYWKKYYNTKRGKGTEEEFIANYEKHCK
jgi:hypothetical protein